MKKTLQTDKFYESGLCLRIPGTFRLAFPSIKRVLEKQKMSGLLHKEAGERDKRGQEARTIGQDTE